MKKIVLFLSLTLTCNLKSFALVNKCNGYYIGLNNDSVACIFDIPIDRSMKTPIYIELQKRVICVDKLSGKKHSFTSKKMNRFVFDFDTAKIEICSIPFGRKNDRIFAKRAVSGYLNIYEYYTENEVRPQSGYTYYGNYGGGYGDGMYSVSTGIFQNFLIQKVGGAFELIDGLNFKAAASDYFGEYPELAEKIKKGEYTKKMIRLIGNEYNLNHLK